MILTDKAQSDFLKWYFEKVNKKLNFKQFSLDIAKVFQNALIVEWLDSVNIKILPCYGLSGWYCELKNYNNNEFVNYKCFLIVKKNINDFDTRTEAIQKAIELANEIYNNLNTKQNEK